MDILFFQTPNGRVKFITSDMDGASSMEYWKFIKFLQETFKLNRYNEMKNELDSFQTIAALDDGNWEVIEPELPFKNQPTMEELIELNKDSQPQFQRVDTEQKEDILDHLEKMTKDKQFKKKEFRFSMFKNPKKQLGWKFYKR